MSYNEKWCKIWRGIDLPFQNWHEEFDRFWPEHLKVSIFFPLMHSFWEKYILFELKTYRGVIFHVTEEWCKICRGTDLPLQNWHEEFVKFWLKHSEVSKICTLIDPFWPKYIMLELKKYRGVMFDNTEDWRKIWKKTDLYFQKWHEEFSKLLQAELNQNKNSKQADRPDAMRKLYFILRINE